MQVGKRYGSILRFCHICHLR